MTHLKAEFFYLKPQIVLYSTECNLPVSPPSIFLIWVRTTIIGNSVDLAFFLPLEMRVLLKRIGSLEAPPIIELYRTNRWYILESCLLLITAIASRLLRQRHNYDASTHLYSSGWKSVRPW
jgi:hypothetical protein